MKITDGKRTISITMKQWDGAGWSSDFSEDFFADGKSVFDRNQEAYVVKDIDYCIEQAMDWKYGNGDYATEKDLLSPSEKLVEID